MPRPVRLAGLGVVQRHGAADGDHPLAQAIVDKSNTLERTAALEMSKAARVRALLVREAGATLDEIMALTGWKPGSCRCFLTALRKHRRYKLRRVRVEGVSHYCLEVLR